MNLKMKKFIYVTLVMGAALFLAACGGGEKKAAKVDNKEGTDLKIEIVSSPSGVDDGSFNQEIYNGVLTFIKNNPDAKVTPVKEETGAPDAAVQAVADIVADYDVIVACGFQFAGISSIAEENPETDFILVDTFPADSEGKEQTYDNVYAMTFAENEGGFFSGVAAALETKTNKVAVVNGIAFPTNVNYQFGFEAGVNYANKHFGTKAEAISLPSYAGTDVNDKNVGGNYIGNFADEATGKVVGKALIDKGVDVLFVAAGGSGNGVFTAAKEAKNVQVIGCDVDQFDDGKNGSENIILTSALKVMSVNVDKQLTNIKDGKFKGANELLTAETDSTGYVKAEGRQQLSKETLAKLAEIYKLVKKGEIVPPTNFSDATPEKFPGL